MRHGARVRLVTLFDELQRIAVRVAGIIYFLNTGKRNLCVAIASKNLCTFLLSFLMLGFNYHPCGSLSVFSNIATFSHRVSTPPLSGGASPFSSLHGVPNLKGNNKMAKNILEWAE